MSEEEGEELTHELDGVSKADASRRRKMVGYPPNSGVFSHVCRGCDEGDIAAGRLKDRGALIGKVIGKDGSEAPLCRGRGGGSSPVSRGLSSGLGSSLESPPSASRGLRGRSRTPGSVVRTRASLRSRGGEKHGGRGR